MSIQRFGLIVGVSVVVCSARWASATEVAGAHSSGFPPGTRYQADVPYRSTSKVDAFTTRPGQAASIVLRGRQALIGVVSPSGLAGGAAPQVIGPDDTPLQTHTTDIGEPAGVGSEAAGSLMTIDVPASPPGAYRLATADGPSVAYGVVFLDGSPYAMDTWMSNSLYHASESPVAYARLYNTQTGEGLRGFKVRARAHLPQLRSAVLKDDGVLPDQAAGDGVYSGTLIARRVLTRKQTLRNGGAVDVAVNAVGRADGVPLRRVGMTSFNWCVPSGSIDGIGPAYLDLPEAARRIIVPVGLTAAQRGHYHLEGNLVGLKDELVAWAEGEVWLRGGSETVPLSFDAGVVAAAGVAPPFSLRKVLLQEEGAEDPVMVDIRENLGTVDGFTLGQLAPAPTATPDPDAGEDLTGLLP